MTRLDLKPGDYVIWLCSPGRSFLAGWRLQHIPGVIERIYRSRIRIRFRLESREKVVTVGLDNVLSDEDC
jgi:hypothetical protein